MKNFLKLILKVAVFLVIFSIIFFPVQELLRAKWGIGTTGARETTNAFGFYDLPENTLDVMVFGASESFYDVSPLTMYENNGFTSYVRGSANQPVYLMYYTILDSLRTQSPEIIVLECGPMLKTFNPADGDEWLTRRGMDYMELSSVKLEAICNLPIDGSDQSKLSYVFPLLRYHSRWSELDQYDFEYFDWEAHNEFKGQYPGISSYEVTLPADYMAVPTEKAEVIPEDTMVYIQKIIDLCKDRGIEPVIIKAPTSGWTYEKHNAIQHIVDENGLMFIDFNLPEILKEIGIDTKKDFHYNEWHLGLRGADKVSVFLGDYLDDTYELPDRRSDSNNSSWDEDLAVYKELKKTNGIETKLTRGTE